MSIERVRPETENSVWDDEAWAEGERFWRAMIDDITASLVQTDQWPRWQPRFYGDGTPVHREDLAICDGRSSRLDRAFRIDQWLRPEPGGWIAAEMRDRAADFLEASNPMFTTIEDANRWFEECPAEDRLAKTELHLRIVLSDVTASIARLLLEKWLRPETTVAEMKALIAETPGVEPW